MAIEAGRLNKRLKLYRPADVRDRRADGQPIDSSVYVAEVWASIEPLSTRESFQQQQVQGSISHRIIVRYRADLRGDWWGVFNGRTFQFTPPRDPDEKHEELEILAEESI
jgi:SPP1 family predicted phage head-tail adaptor